MIAGRALAVVVCGTAAAVLGGPGVGSAAGPVSFSAVAAAEGVRVRYDVPDYLVVSNFLDGGGPVAQSTLSSAGESRSFASLPYPGETALAFPGLLAGFGGPELPAGYPFHAAAEYPTRPQATVDDPSGGHGFHLGAAAAADRSAAEATTRPALMRSTATSVVERLADGTVQSRAESMVEGLAAGGVLQIGSVHSRSVARLVAGAAAPVAEHRLTVTGAAVNGVAVTVTEHGVVAGGSTLPGLPAEATIAARRALADAGVDVALVQARALDGGTTSESLRITSRHALPVPGDPQGIATLTVGATLAQVVTNAAGLPVAVAVPVPGSGSFIGDPSPEAPSAGPPPEPVTIPPAPLSDPPAGPSSTLPPGDGFRPAVPAADPVAGSANPDTPGEGDGGALPPQQAAAIDDWTPESSGPISFVYLVLAAAAAVGVAGSTLWCRKGGAARWTS